MTFYQFKQSQKIPAGLEEVWTFISQPGNLKNITPPYMGFQVTNGTGSEAMYPGMIITYKVSPVLGVPMDWVTEITHVKDLEFFVDEQRIGPYKMWHHQHKLTSIKEGVRMDDIVTYQPPFGIIGAMANVLFIRRQLQQIFNYRRVAVEKIFGEYQKGLDLKVSRF